MKRSAQFQELFNSSLTFRNWLNEVLTTIGYIFSLNEYEQESYTTRLVEKFKAEQEAKQ